jgi:hypothetical protein
MRHAQVSTTMRYGNAYMAEKRKAHGAVVQMVLPARREAVQEMFSLIVGILGVFFKAKNRS